MPKTNLDAIDRKILKYLINNARMPFLEIARECGISGAAIHQRIRKLDDERKASIPIIALTADAFEEDRQKALRCGMDGHLTKPIEIDKLFEALDTMLG